MNTSPLLRKERNTIMAEVRVFGWGGGTAWRNHIDDAGGGPFRVLGWSSGQQWRMFCADQGTRVEGNDGGPQYKLVCDQPE
jgi:hypothetical protein